MHWLDVGVTSVIALTVIALAMLRRHEIRSRSLALFRVLLPSWRFFEQVHPGPRLWCRFAALDAEFGSWQELLRAPPAGWQPVLINARGNLRLACLSAVEQLCNELETLAPEQDPAQLTSYQVVSCIVEVQLAELLRAGGPLRYQFCVAEPGSEAQAFGEQLLLSTIHTRAPSQGMRAA